jgi:uroporphyrinogen decarboxylase
VEGAELVAVCQLDGNLDGVFAARQRLDAYTGDPTLPSRFGNHICGFSYDGWPTETEPGSEIFRDDYGVLWNRRGADKDIGVVDAPICAEADLSRLPEPVLDEARLRREAERALANRGERFCHAGIGFSLFERYWSYCGMENALAHLLLEPDFALELLDRICDFNLRIINILSEYPFDGFYFGDDWGQQHGLITGPKLWREFFRPRLAKMYDAAKKNGKFLIQHSCGDIEELFPDLIDLGLDCYQTFQPEIYDVAAVKKKYGANLSFWGGISTQQLLPCATPDEVRAETRRLMKILAVNGGYIAGPTHAVPGDVPPENILAMADVLQNQ